MQIRTGEVCELDYEKCLARVKFPDMDNFISAWLQVGQRNTLNNKDYWMPEIGEQVVCAVGDRSGSVMYAVYNDVDLPVFNNQHIRGVKFSDDTEIYYDRENHKLVININKDSGEVNVTADKKVYYSNDLDIKAKNSFKVKSIDVNIGDSGATVNITGRVANIDCDEVNLTPNATFPVVHAGCNCLFLGVPHVSNSKTKTN